MTVISDNEWNDQNATEPPARTSRTAAPVPSSSEYSESADETPAENSAANFEFDANRLYDPSYENDPALIELAARQGISPACLIARVKSAIDQVPATEACANEESRYDYSAHKLSIWAEEIVCEELNGHELCRTVRKIEHPYDDFSDAELRYLADSSAEASFLLAKRLGWDDEAESLFEQAVALSGKSGPLVQILILKDAVGISRTNGDLDVPRAMTTYEVSLVMNWLGWPDDSLLRAAEASLVGDGHDLRAIKQRAEKRYDRITQRRLELLGYDWDGN
jgi:hypothetical protein